MRHFTLSQVTLPPGLHLETHQHEAGQLCAVLEGGYAEHWDGRDIRLDPGSVLIRAPGEPHRDDVGSREVQVLLLDLSARFWRDLRLVSGRSFLPGVFAELIADIRDEIRRADATVALALEALVVLLSLRAARVPATDTAVPAWVLEAVRVISTRFSEPLSLRIVASAVGISPARLAAGFRRYRGRSVGEAIAQMRLDFVRRELASSRRKIAEIAADAGFYDESHLGRVFRRRYRISPLTFRQRRA
jgi:AraC-like DNA-binding protein